LSDRGKGRGPKEWRGGGTIQRGEGGLFSPLVCLEKEVITGEGRRKSKEVQGRSLMSDLSAPCKKGKEGDFRREKRKRKIEGQWSGRLNKGHLSFARACRLVGYERSSRKRKRERP